MTSGVAFIDDLGRAGDGIETGLTRLREVARTAAGLAPDILALFGAAGSRHTLARFHEKYDLC